MSEISKIYFPTKEDWRKWLKKNHIKESKVAVIRYKKHTGKPSPSHLELMHEAICFGWIDTTVKGLDGEKYLINFSKRNDKSRWSDNTLRYGKELIRQGRMFPEGLKHYEAGRKRPTHDAGIPKNPSVPVYLREALEKDKIAKDSFDKLAPSYKKTLLRWLLRAKLEETKKKRVKIIVNSAKKNKKNLF